ncbi:MAG: TonB family protein [Syntrophobacteraceae bacterium]
MERILDPRAVASWPECEEHSDFSYFRKMELSADDAPTALTRKPAGKELLAGVAGSLLFHCLLAASCLLLVQYIQPPPPARPLFMNVYMANTENAEAGSSGAGSGYHAEDEQDRHEPSAEDRPAGAVPVHQSAIAGCRIEPVSVKEKTLKIKKAHQESKRKPRPKDPADPGDPAATSPKIGSEDIKGDSESLPGHSPGTGTGKDPGSSSDRFSGPVRGEFDAASVDHAPQVLTKWEPVYPQKARSLGICGKVVLRFLVEPNGQVSHPGILEAQPRGYFEQSALEAVRRWRFKPGYVQGKAVATWFILPVQFKLIEED